MENETLNPIKQLLQEYGDNDDFADSPEIDE